MMDGVHKSRVMFSDHRLPKFLPCATDVILGCGENNTFDRSRERNALFCIFMPFFRIKHSVYPISPFGEFPYRFFDDT